MKKKEMIEPEEAGQGLRWHLAVGGNSTPARGILLCALVTACIPLACAPPAQILPNGF